MLGPKDHANALGTRGSALALEGKTVAHLLITHTSSFIISSSGAWGVLSVRRSFSGGGI